MRWWWVLLGGGFGAVCRVALVEWFSHRSGEFPWGVLAANGLGCLAIGLLFAVSESREISDTTRLALQGGFLGGFTTFSAFGLDTYRLFEAGAVGAAAMNAFGNFSVGLAAVFLGIALGRGLA